MVYMLLQSSTVNEYIIKLHHYDFTETLLKQLSHHSHEGTKSIRQSKWHN